MLPLIDFENAHNTLYINKNEGYLPPLNFHLRLRVPFPLVTEKLTWLGNYLLKNKIFIKKAT